MMTNIHLIFSKGSLISLLLVAFLPTLVAGQSETKPKKQVGPQTLTLDLGLYHAISGVYPFQGPLIGLERKRQRLIAGATFGKNLFYPESEKTYGLNGYFVDYSFTFFHPFKWIDLAVFARFQYNYQARVRYYEPPAQDLILYSRYQESFYALGGLDLRVNIFRNFQVFAKIALGKKYVTSQLRYPYYPDGNSFNQYDTFSDLRTIGIIYGIPLTKK